MLFYLNKNIKDICRNCNVSSFTSKIALDNHLLKCGNSEIMAENITVSNEEKLFVKTILINHLSLRKI